jgi:hypothetical protein
MMILFIEKPDGTRYILNKSNFEEIDSGAEVPSTAVFRLSPQAVESITKFVDGDKSRESLTNEKIRKLEKEVVDLKDKLSAIRSLTNNI